MAIRELAFASSNGRDYVKGWSYSPLGEPKAVVQIVHGFGEHSRRYLHMINTFLAAGYAVYADDHIGHGKTGYDSGTLGDPHSKDYMTFVQDEKSLHDIAVQDYPGVPYFIFGHSWGSLISRAYAARFGSDLSGMMLSGVVSMLKGCELLRNNPEMEAAFRANPDQPADEWVLKAFQCMLERIPNFVTGSDWVANDPRIIADYLADPFNAKRFTLQMLWDFVGLYSFVEGEAWAGMVPSDLPFCLMAGDHDPCGNYGEGLYHVANMLITSGNQVQVKVYPGYRHEIHNELAIRDDVEQNLINFIERVIKG